MDRIAFALHDELANESLQNPLIIELEQVRQVAQEIDRYNQFDVYMDIADFGQLISRKNTLAQLISEVTIAEYHGKDRPQANGISVVFFNPPNAWVYNTCDPNYKNWDEASASGNKGKFINETEWDEMLARYYGLVIPALDQISENHRCNTLFE